MEHADPNGAGRYRRDVREATKYIETAIVIDKAMFDKRNGSTRAEVVHDAIQVANIADLVNDTFNSDQGHLTKVLFLISVFSNIEYASVGCVYRDVARAKSSSNRWWKRY